MGESWKMSEFGMCNRARAEAGRAFKPEIRPPVPCEVYAPCLASATPILRLLSFEPLFSAARIA